MLLNKLSQSVDSFLLKVNINELVFDLTVSLFAVFFYRLAGVGPGIFSGEIGLFTAFLLIMSVQFFMSLFLADILQTFDRYRDDCFADHYPAGERPYSLFERLNEWMLLNPYIYIVIVILYFVSINGLYILMPLELYKAVGVYVDAQRISGGMNAHLDILTVFLTGLPVLIVGLMMFKGAGHLQRWYGIALVPAMMFTFVWPLSTKYFAHAFGLVGGFVFLLVTIPLFAGIIYMKKLSAERQYTRRPALARFLKPVRNVVVPFSTAVAMVFWHELVLSNTNRLLEEKLVEASLLNALPWLLLSGLIPVRLIVLLVPPVRPINILISLLTMGFFLTAVNRLLNLY